MERGDATGLQLGFRGFAAGFQTGVAGFLETRRDLLSGLTRIEDADTFLSCIADIRPDYLFLSDPNDPPDLLEAIGAAARGAQCAVLVVDDPGTTTDVAVSGLVLERVAPEATDLEVALTLRALLRRTRAQAMVGQMSWGVFELDEACLTFAVRGQQVPLSLEVFSVLGVMMDDPGRIWDRAELHRLVFGADSPNDIRAIDTRVSRARRHVANALGFDPIRTVRGVGYALATDP